MNGPANRRLSLAAGATCALILLLAGGPAGSQRPTAPFDSGRTSFAVAFQDEIARYRVLGAFVMPGEEVKLRVMEDDENGTYRLATEMGEVLETGRRSWRWRAPAEAGVYSVSVTRQDSDQTVRLNVFVMVPRNRVVGGRLNGYRIGDYPDKPLKGLAAYKPPPGFVEVTVENASTPVSPHFTLGQFLCKQENGYPKYLVLKTRLLRKLEYVLQRINAAGIRCDGLAVMSGYRTPWYNQVIGNVQYSRHVWGGAADVYVDENPRDGQMDDLNGDGRIDVKDAAVVYRIVDDQHGRKDWEPFVGGLGQYRRTANHGPFVHVDVRGFRARWGD